MPGTKDVGKNIKEIRAKHPGKSKAEVTAIALSQARRAGANIPKPKAKKR